MLPVRWMAPESLTDGVFTTMSDIWSYGVLLYEIVTFGAFPFQGMTNDQVLEHVKAGHTIAIPRGVKPQLDVLLKTCWNRNPMRRPQVLQIIEHLINYPRLISPCLDGPQSSVQIEDTVSLEMRIPDKTRKLSLSINNRLQNVASSSRKRSMSGNMVMNIPPLTTSLSEDGMISAHSNLDALNLNHVMLEESEVGEDPLLPPAQYVSSRYMSLAHKDHKEKEKESLVSRQQGDYCTTDISRDLWTSVTPV
ncbi:insulin-like peptide receptor [Cherax quadricarinatus]